MSLKITVIFLCAAVGTATGYMIMRSFKQKHEYLCELLTVIAELKHNISYRRDGVANVFKSLNIKNKLLNKNIQSYIEYAVGSSDSPNIGKGYLTDEVYKLSTEFFSSIGRSDGKSQADELDMYERKFGLLSADAAEKSKKSGGAAVKLGFLIGLGIGILIL